VESLTVRESRSLVSRGQEAFVRKQVEVRDGANVLADYVEVVALYDTATITDLAGKSGFIVVDILGDYSGINPEDDQPRRLYIMDGA
jgi:hypothetical protein